MTIEEAYKAVVEAKMKYDSFWKTWDQNSQGAWEAYKELEEARKEYVKQGGTLPFRSDIT
jgi:hypothetical protein